MKTLLDVLGFEPAVDRALKALLAFEPDFEVVSHPEQTPRVLVIGPSSRQQLEDLRRRHPDSLFVVQEPWNQAPAPPEEDERVLYFQGFHGFSGILDLLRQAI